MELPMTASSWLRAPSIEELIEAGVREGLRLTEAEAGDLDVIVTEMFHMINGLSDISVSPGPPSAFTDRARPAPNCQ